LLKLKPKDVPKKKYDFLEDLEGKSKFAQCLTKAKTLRIPIGLTYDEYDNWGAKN